MYASGYCRQEVDSKSKTLLRIVINKFLCHLWLTPVSSCFSGTLAQHLCMYVLLNGCCVIDMRRCRETWCLFTTMSWSLSWPFLKNHFLGLFIICRVVSSYLFTTFFFYCFNLWLQSPCVPCLGDLVVVFLHCFLAQSRACLQSCKMCCSVFNFLCDKFAAQIVTVWVYFLSNVNFLNELFCF